MQSKGMVIAMGRFSIKQRSASTAAPSPYHKTKDAGLKKLKVLITVVNRSKALFYTDLLEEYEINMQTVIYGSGTADSSMLSLLGLVETDKAVILSVVREDNVKTVLSVLEEKFERVKGGKGIAFTVAMNSIIGVSVYQFLSNNRMAVGKGE